MGRADSGPGSGAKARVTPGTLGAGVRAGNAAPCGGTGRGYSGPAPVQVANGRGGAE